MGALPAEIRLSEQAFLQLTKWAWIFGFRVPDFEFRNLMLHQLML
jgi:hypothetical protein